MKCPYCGSPTTYKSRRSARGLLRLVSLAMVLARCHNCFRSFWTRGTCFGNDLDLP
jgi:uncharacterized protein with PIN domain